MLFLQGNKMGSPLPARPTQPKLTTITGPSPLEGLFQAGRRFLQTNQKRPD